MNTDEKHILETLVAHFGAEKMIAALPQQQVAKLLDLVSVKELADEMRVNHNTFRSWMKEGKIPFPNVRLVRRAFYTREQANEIKQEWNRRD